VNLRDIKADSVASSTFIKRAPGLQKSEISGIGSFVDAVSIKGGNDAGPQKSVFSPEIMKKACRENKKVFSNAHTQELAQKLLEKKKDGVREEILQNTDKRMHSKFVGIPDSVKLFDHSGVTFRHYFGSKEDKSRALSENSLVAGPVSYAQVSSGIRKDFTDLVGIFLTMPDVEPGYVGVSGHNSFVDLKLPEDTAILEIEPGKIYMIPGEPKRQGWIVENYKKFKKGEPVPSYMLEMLRGIDKKGGIKKATRVYFEAEEGTQKS